MVVEDLTGAPTAEAGPARVLTCSETEVTLEGSASGSDGRDGYTYAWEPASEVSDPASPTPTTSTDGTFTLTVTDVFTGCTGTDTVEVTRDEQPPIAEAGPDRYRAEEGACDAQARRAQRDDPRERQRHGAPVDVEEDREDQCHEGLDHGEDHEIGARLAEEYPAAIRRHQRERRERIVLELERKRAAEAE